jgi:hypothetical protein
MGKVTLVLEDLEDGEVDVQLLFDPPIEQADSELTPAQSMGIFAVQTLSDLSGAISPAGINYDDDFADLTDDDFDGEKH